MVSGKNGNTAREIVMRDLAEAQFSLFGYICALTGHSQDARDILQDTNLRIWKEAERYDEKRPFLAWAKTLAVYEIMTYRKRLSRERLVFDDDVFESVVDQAEIQPDETDAALAHRKCPAKHVYRICSG
ncbi:MAG TPA: sigma factor [Kiritimatiellia bacterium]|nr:sigma factor [Kiritimatiellia bacterium]HRU70415.1 sigma factor [Kiritimatiellia bacterium]